MQYNVIYFSQTVEYIGRSEAFYCVPAVDYISMVKTVIKIPKVKFKLEKGILVRVNNTSGVWPITCVISVWPSIELTTNSSSGANLTLH